MIRFLLAAGAALSLLYCLVIYSSGRSAIHEIQAGVANLSFCVLATGLAIVYRLEQLLRAVRDEAQKPDPHRYP